VDSAAIEQGWGPKAFCPPDEHYIPTLLASLGLDNETDCRVRSALLACQHVSLPDFKTSTCGAFQACPARVTALPL
jgi:hypothetical protein